MQLRATYPPTSYALVAVSYMIAFHFQSSLCTQRIRIPLPLRRNRTRSLYAKTSYPRLFPFVKTSYYLRKLRANSIPIALAQPGYPLRAHPLKPAKLARITLPPYFTDVVHSILYLLSISTLRTHSGLVLHLGQVVLLRISLSGEPPRTSGLLTYRFNYHKNTPFVPIFALIILRRIPPFRDANSVCECAHHAAQTGVTLCLIAVGLAMRRLLTSSIINL